MNDVREPLPPDESQRCPNCGAAIKGPYCQECGQKRVSSEDLAARRFFREIWHEATDLDSKVFRTFKALFFRPGLLTFEYLTGRRGRYLSPVKLYLLVSAVYFFFAWDASLKISRFEESLKADPSLRMLTPPNVDQGLFLQEWFERAGNYSAYFRFAGVLGFGLALAILYYQRKHYFGENLIFAFHYYCFDFAFYSLLILILVAFQAVTGQAAAPWTLFLGMIVLLVYLFFALRRAYRETALAAAVKALFLLLCDMGLNFVGDVLALGLAAVTTYLSKD